MKVLIFCQLFPPLIYGGGEVLFWNLARSLAAHGHEVHVITQKVRGQEVAESICGVNIWRVGSPVDYSGALTTSLQQSVAYLLTAFFMGIRIGLRRRVDVIHSNTYVPSVVGQLCAMVMRKRHVMTVHDVYLASLPWFWDKWSKQPTVGLLARLFGPLIERTLLHMPVAAIHTVSDTSKRDLLEIGTKAKIVVVPNGIDVDEYRTRADVGVDNHQAIFIGRLVFYKNLEVVFRALARTIRAVPDAKLVVVGDGPMKTGWENMVRDLGLAHRVLFQGRVPQQEKLMLLEQSAFLVLPSIVEGFGIVTLEAFACMKPVLASAISALSELVSDGVDGYLLDPASEEDWADKMIALFGNAERTHQMGLMGQDKLLLNFTIDRVAEQMEHLYESQGKDKSELTPSFSFK